MWKKSECRDRFLESSGLQQKKKKKKKRWVPTLSASQAAARRLTLSIVPSTPLRADTCRACTLMWTSFFTCVNPFNTTIIMGSCAVIIILHEKTGDWVMKSLSKKPKVAEQVGDRAGIKHTTLAPESELPQTPPGFPALFPEDCPTASCTTARLLFTGQQMLSPFARKLSNWVQLNNSRYCRHCAEEEKSLETDVCNWKCHDVSYFYTYVLTFLASQESFGFTVSVCGTVRPRIKGELCAGLHNQ